MQRNCSQRATATPLVLFWYILARDVSCFYLVYLNDNFVDSDRRAIIGCPAKRQTRAVTLHPNRRGSPFSRTCLKTTGGAHFSPMAVRGSANRHPCIGGGVNRRSVPLSPRPRRRLNLLADKRGFPLGPRNERRRSCRGVALSSVSR